MVVWDLGLKKYIEDVKIKKLIIYLRMSNIILIAVLDIFISKHIYFLSFYSIWIIYIFSKKYLKMGTACTCLKEYHADDQQINIEKEEILSKNVQQMEIKENNLLSQVSKISYSELIKFQSFLRCYIEKMHVKEIISKEINIKHLNIEISQRETFEINEDIPDYSNLQTKAAEKRCGMFIYSEKKENSVKTIMKKPMFLENGAVYIGEWSENNERHGRGIQLWNDGSKYEGYWKNDKANGTGRLIHGDGDVYEGDWKDDRAHGYGVYIHTDGANYEGNWVEDKQHGQGIESWPDGAKYDGGYLNGKKHGVGSFKWADGSAYKGQFFNNDIHGHGLYYWNDGRQYDGEWKNNKMDGKGVFLWSDGRKYVGEYSNDKKQGFGIFEWPDKKKYEGQWLDGKQHGKGIFYSPDGERKEGLWKEGRRLKIHN